MKLELLLLLLLRRRRFAFRAMRLSSSAAAAARGQVQFDAWRDAQRIGGGACCCNLQLATGNVQRASVACYVWQPTDQQRLQLQLLPTAHGQFLANFPMQPSSLPLNPLAPAAQLSRISNNANLKRCICKWEMRLLLHAERQIEREDTRERERERACLSRGEGSG